MSNSNEKSTGRIAYVDVAKGILITLVVFLHVPHFLMGVPAYENDGFLQMMKNLQFLYAPFFMSAFFVLTGYCSNFDKDFSKFLTSSLKTTVLPCFTITPIIYIIRGGGCIY